MMRMVRDKLDDLVCIAVWFDAWRYAQHDALWRALLISVVESIRERIVHDSIVCARSLVGGGTRFLARVC